MVLHGENAEQSEVNLNMTVARAFKSVLVTISVADVHILFQHPEPLSDCCDPRKPDRQSRIVQEPSRLNDFNVLTSSFRRHEPFKFHVGPYENHNTGPSDDSQMRPVFRSNIIEVCAIPPNNIVSLIRLHLYSSQFERKCGYIYSCSLVKFRPRNKNYGSRLTAYKLPG